MLTQLNTHNLVNKVKNSSKSIDNVVIIIPTYNESGIIESTINQVFGTLRKANEFKICILIFDSASTDNTVNIVRSLQNKYTNLYIKTEEKKTGLGSAYLQAMNYAIDTLNADIVFEFDADLSHQPKYILPMLNLMHDYDCVIGSRYVKGGTIPSNWPTHRKLLSITGNYIARAILHPRYKDFTSGFRATKTHILKKILPTRFLSNNYAYKLHLLWLLHKTNASVCECPIEFIDRTVGESKLPKHSIKDSLRVIFTLRYRELKRYLKMCLVGGIGLIVQLITYNFLRQFIPPFYAAQLAVLVAIVNNFLLNNRYTFKNKIDIVQSKKIKQFSLFILYSIFIIYVQSVWLDLGIDYLGQGVIQENSIVALGILLISILNYFIYSRHIWID